MAKATRGSDAQFTYDFGIAIAQSTLSKITRLTGVTLSLASAFYALKSTATEYVNTLRENTFRFGGILSTMKAMEQAQERLIKGQSLFSVDDQLRGMNQLMASGINVRKNLDWISKAAHASGQSLSQFSGAISNAIAGNMGQLVDMGLITQRATRMFDKYAANTVMRQQAILNFVKNHKGLMAAIRNDFYTIQDQMLRIKETWKAFLQSILGKPNDPSSFYGQIAQSMKMIADALAKNLEQIKRIGFVIGSVLGWVMKQIGQFVVWIGKKMKQSLSSVWKMTDNYAEFTRSLIVWLEFWKVRIIDFFKEYSGAIKLALKLLLAYKALKLVFLISRSAISSVVDYGVAMRDVLFAIKNIYNVSRAQGLGRIASGFMSLGRLIPEQFRLAYLRSVKWLALLNTQSATCVSGIGRAFRGLSGLIVAPFKVSFKSIRGILKMIPGILNAAIATPLMLGGNAKGTRILGTALDKIKEGAGDIVNTIKDDLVGKAWDVIKGGFGSMFTFLKTGFTGAVNGLKTLFMSLNATNPVGWIIIAVTAATILYMKCKTFRVLVNNMFKAWWEWIKFLYNLVYGAFIAIAVGCKKTWEFLNNYVFKPVANFFKKAYTWIRQMWNSFKDTSVGRFIDKWIVSPIRSLCDWLMKALRWMLKGAASILSVINKSLAEEIRKGEKELGMDRSFAASGGNYDTHDDTNYLDPSNWNVDIPGLTDKDKDKTPKNPISDVNNLVGSGGGGTTVNNNMDFGSGAIQIIVQKGNDIDERRLAKLVGDTLKDINREYNMRGGMV